MKFAGPSMGAALGSGFAGGIASAQDMMQKEELQRDTSAMSTYSKLVSSGEWEPVGKEGVKDGGVLRVGNVGFLRKVERPQGLSLADQYRLSQIQRNVDLTRQGDERLALSKDKPETQVNFYSPTGEWKGLGPKGSPPPNALPGTGYSVNAQRGRETSEERTQSGRELGVAKDELRAAEKVINRNSSLVSILEGSPEAKTPFGRNKIKEQKDAIKKRDKAQKEIDKSLGRSRGLPFVAKDTVKGDLLKDYPPPVVEKYKEILPKMQQAIDSGDITKEEILNGIMRLLGPDFSSGGSDKVRLPMPSRR